MVIGVVVLGATFMAVSLQAPPSPQQNPSTETTESKTYSSLKALDDLYIDDERYNHSALSKALADAAAGNQTPLVNSIETFLPDNSRFCVYLNNGESRIQLHCPDEPPGAAVGVSYPIEPNWRFHYAEPDLAIYDKDSNQKLGLSQIPILNAHTIWDEGHYVNVSVEGTQDWTMGLNLDDSEATNFRETAYSTLLQGDTSVDYPSATIFMECERNGGTEPCYATDLLGGSSLDGYHPYKQANSSNLVRFTVNNSGPGALEADTPLKIRFPVGLDVNNSNVSSPNGGFDSIAVAGDNPETETVNAELASDLSPGGTASLDVWVDRTDSRYVYKHVDAELSNNSVSTSQFLFRVSDRESGVWTGGDSRVTMISTPKPAGSATGSDPHPESRWGVAVPVPFGESGIQNLTFELVDGDKVIEDVYFPDDYNPPDATATDEDNDVLDGTLTHTDSTITWEPKGPALNYSAYTFAEFQFIVETSGEQTLASPNFPMTQPRATFGGYSPPPQSIQMEPGIWWRGYSPDDPNECRGGCPGYANDDSLSVSSPMAEHTADVTVTRRGIPLDATTDYEIADLNDDQRLGIKDAIEATSLDTSPYRTSPGETVSLRLDASDLAKKISETTGLSNMDLETEIYAPWGIPNRTPAETYTHQVVAGQAYEAPNDLQPLYINGDNAEDILTASTDGNVYGLDGESGDQIGGAVFGLPSGSGTNPSTPNILDMGTDSNGHEIIGVGTKSGLNDWYTIDDNLDERWAGTKPDGGATPDASVKTFGVHVGRDLTGDGVPDPVLSTNAKNVSRTSGFNESRLTIWNGVDTDGDGRGEILEPWRPNFDVEDVGIVITGEATEIGTANVGVTGREGIFANTGEDYGTNVQYIVNQSLQKFWQAEPKQSVSEAKNVTAEISGAGLLGFNEDAKEVFNLTGARAARAQVAEQITEGDKFSGIAMGGLDGWVWGLNASGPIYPTYGWTILGTRGYTDLAMANDLEGYLVSIEGEMIYTRNGFTTKKYYNLTGEDDAIFFPDTGTTTVDTPDGDYRSEASSVSWWAGEYGTLKRSADRLDSVEDGVKSAMLEGTVSVDADAGTVDADASQILKGTLAQLDLSDVNYTDVYAASADEAWLTGRGIDGSALDGNGYIVHATDGGANLSAIEVDCGGTNCELNSITAEDHHVWVAGDNGLVLVRDTTGQASKVQLNGTANMTPNGRIQLPLNSSEEVEIANVTVGWDDGLAITVKDRTVLKNSSGRHDLWNHTKGCPDYIDGTSLDCNEDYGNGNDRTAFVADYVKDSSDGDNRTLNGSATLFAGPYADIALDSTLELTDPYKDRSWYNDSNKLPITWTINVTYADGSQDGFTVNVDENFEWTSAETSEAFWTFPEQATKDVNSSTTFSAPDCFGQPGGGCPDINSINVTNLGTHEDPSYVGLAARQPNAQGSTITRLAEGTLTWENATVPTDAVMRDAAVNPTHPDRMIAVGEEGRTLVSYDGGYLWRSMPETVDMFREVDYTHPVVPTIVGGKGNGQLFTLNGYVQSGTAQTKDIYDESEFDGAGLEKINLTTLPDVSNDDGGHTPVEIEVWDPNKGSNGEWATLYESAVGARLYNFSAAVTEVKLKFNLDTEDLFRFSPLVGGSMTLGGYTENDLASPNASFDFSMAEKSKFQTPLDAVDYDEDDGHIRLNPVRNPWLQRLGNPDEGSWSSVKNGSVGARVADMEVAPNGSTIWAISEGIYAIGSATESPIDESTCNGPNSQCYDNTLYAINASTGRRADWWDPMHFDNVPQKLAVGTQAVAVTTGNLTDTNQEKSVYRIDIDNPTKDKSRTWTDTSKSPKVLVLADAFPESNSVWDDPIVSLQDLGAGDGRVYGYEAPDVVEVWKAQPEIQRIFDFSYEVPTDALYGSRIAVSKVDWRIDDAYNGSIVQTARIHDAFKVTPDGRSMPLAPTYTLEVVAWLEDWR